MPEMVLWISCLGSSRIARGNFGRYPQILLSWDVMHISPSPRKAETGSRRECLIGISLEHAQKAEVSDSALFCSHGSVGLTKNPILAHMNY